MCYVQQFDSGFVTWSSERPCPDVVEDVVESGIHVAAQVVDTGVHVAEARVRVTQPAASRVAEVLDARLKHLEER